MKKVKTYSVPIRTHVSADYIINAYSKEDAHKKVAKEMEQSLKRKLKEAIPHPQIRNIDGYTETLKSQIEIIEDEMAGS